MTHLAELIIIFIANGFFILGLHIITRPDMIFGFVGDFISYYLGNKASKPIHDCPPCMASVWGSIVYLIVMFHFCFPLIYLVGLPFYCLCLSGFVLYING